MYSVMHQCMVDGIFLKIFGIRFFYHNLIYNNMCRTCMYCMFTHVFLDCFTTRLLYSVNKLIWKGGCASHSLHINY